jgi:SNF2 family DNA or RNA helicase
MTPPRFKDTTTTKDGSRVPVTAELDSKIGRIVVETEWRHKELLRGIPGAKWKQELGHDGLWTLPVSWSSCLALRSTFGSELAIGEHLQLWAKNEKQNRVDPCLHLREQVDYPGDPSLFGWQRSGLEFILYGKQVLIADDPGAGKTATTIRGLARIQQVHDAGHDLGEPVFPILVVCPNSMKRTWAREFETWWPGLKVNVVKGTAAKRRKILEDKAHVYVINFEAVKGHSRLAPYGSVAMTKCQEHGGEDPKISAARCQVHEKELNKIPFRAVVVDEAHRIKEGKSQQTRAVKAAAGDAGVRIALTGTPIANDVTDLWSILNFLEPEEFASKTRWIGRYVETMLNAWGGMVVIGIKATMQKEFQQVIDSRMRRMQEDVVLRHLPPIIYHRRDCEMSAKQAKAYKEMKDNMVTALEDGAVLTADSPMTKATRLLQLASSFGEVEVTEYTDAHGFPKVRQKVTLTEPSAKLDTFMDELEDFGDESVAVMAVSRQLIKLLSKRLEKKGIAHGCITGDEDEDQRQQAMDDFQSGKIQFILFTTGAGGTGITLTKARYLCRLQLPYSFVDYKQSLRRVRRIGSEKFHENIIVIDYVTEDTLDTHVFDVLFKKEQNFEDVVRDNDALLRMLKEDPS